jgi:hypothetical protein
LEGFGECSQAIPCELSQAIRLQWCPWIFTQPMRIFSVPVMVTVRSGTGVLIRVSVPEHLRCVVHFQKCNCQWVMDYAGSSPPVFCNESTVYVLMRFLTAGWHDTNEISASPRKVTCSCCRECGVHPWCGVRNLHSFFAGMWSTSRERVVLCPRVLGFEVELVQCAHQLDCLSGCLSLFKTGGGSMASRLWQVEEKWCNVCWQRVTVGSSFCRGS